VHEFGIDTAKWVDVEPVSIGKHVPPSGRVSVNVKLNQIINFFADADGPIFRDGRRLTRAKGLTLTCSKNETVTPLVVTSTLVMFMKLVPNVGDIELVNDFLETVQLIARLHLEGTELISQLQLDIAGRVDDVALDLDATIVRDGAVEDLR
jgi:hypothetical protein